MLSFSCFLTNYHENYNFLHFYLHISNFFRTFARFFVNNPKSALIVKQ